MPLQPFFQLSKSSFIRGLQCEKSLYLHTHHKELRNPDDPNKQRIFARGTEVGELARELFPGGMNAAYGKDFSVSANLKRTKELLEADVPIIYEAAFVFNGVLAIADIAVRKGKKWSVYEVKSSSEVKDVHVNDAAIQYYVLNGAGFSIRDVSIVTLSKAYIRHGELEIQKLFHIQSVLKEVKNLQRPIPETVERFKKVLAAKSMPPIDIGIHCSQPYDCDFSNFCWKHIPDDSVFDIAGIRKTKAFDLYMRGIVKINDIPEKEKFSESQIIQINCAKKNIAVIETSVIQQFLRSLHYPLYFMDFESFMPAVPMYDNSRPYQQIVFQYSLHCQGKPNGKLLHCEFLADAKNDPREEFIKHLLNDTKKEGDILVYNNSFEGPRLKELARDFPQYKKELEERISRIKDLMVPFRQKALYHPQLKGSYSIKNVLPVLAPEFSYDHLPINHGGPAMSAYEQLLQETDMKKVLELRNDLLAYCKMDTLAMVKVVEGLKIIIK